MAMFVQAVKGKDGFLRKERRVSQRNKMNNIKGRGKLQKDREGQVLILHDTTFGVSVFCVSGMQLVYMHKK